MKREAGTLSLADAGAFSTTRKIRVMIVDDSAVVRRLVGDALETEPGIEVVGTAPNGAVALERIPIYNPDLVTLDVEMPEMDGIETLRRIRAKWPRLRVLMCSTLTERGASVTIEALSLGASDYVTKVSAKGGATGGVDQALSLWRAQLIPKIKQFFPQSAPMPETTRRAPAPLAAPARKVRPQVLAIGVSTGGPTALSELIPALPADFPLPILIVQHMPPLFTKLLAQRLAAQSAIRVEEAVDGATIETGKALIAPGDFHMRAEFVRTQAVVKLGQEAPENSCRPAVDPLFRSVAGIWGAAAIGVILTGMGQDGYLGAEVMKSKGACILAQDEASSVVWGMPGIVARSGLADAVVPLKSMVAQIQERCRL